MPSLLALVLLGGIGFGCDSTRDPFCRQLEDAMQAENTWLATDELAGTSEAFRNPCIPGASTRIQDARRAAKRKTEAFRRYYADWLALAQNSFKEFSRGVPGQADFSAAVERLLAQAEKDHAALVARASVLSRGSAAERALADLTRQARQRVTTLQEAIQRTRESRNSLSSAFAASETIRDRMRAALQSISAEGLLWDAYYEGIATWIDLRCGAQR